MELTNAVYTLFYASIPIYVTIISALQLNESRTMTSLTLQCCNKDNFNDIPNKGLQQLLYVPVQSLVTVLGNKEKGCEWRKLTMNHYNIIRKYEIREYEEAMLPAGSIASSSCYDLIDRAEIKVILSCIIVYKYQAWKI